MPRHLPTFLAAMLTLTGFAHADELAIDGFGISRDVECGGKDVGIYGLQHAVTLTGTCGRITVSGSKHTISFEEGSALLVSGIENKVTGGTVRDMSVDVSRNVITATLGGGGAKGKLAAAGEGNRISLVLAGPARLEVNGADQVVEWARAEGAPNPEVTSSGVKNAIRRKP